MTFSTKLNEFCVLFYFQNKSLNKIDSGPWCKFYKLLFFVDENPDFVTNPI